MSQHTHTPYLSSFYTALPGDGSVVRLFAWPMCQQTLGEYPPPPTCQLPPRRSRFAERGDQLFMEMSSSVAKLNISSQEGLQQKHHQQHIEEKTHRRSEIAQDVGEALVVDLRVLAYASINLFALETFSSLPERRLTHSHLVDDASQTKPVRAEGVSLAPHNLRRYKRNKK